MTPLINCMDKPLQLLDLLEVLGKSVSILTRGSMECKKGVARSGCSSSLKGCSLR